METYSQLTKNKPKTRCGLEQFCKEFDLVELNNFSIRMFVNVVGARRNAKSHDAHPQKA